MATARKTERPIRLTTRKLEREINEIPAGKGVANTYRRLLAVADTAEEVHRVAQEAGVKRYVVWRMPRDDEWPFG